MAAAEAAALRDSGASLALDAEPFKVQIAWAITKAARSFLTFTGDDVRAILEEEGITEFAHPNSWGGAFLQARAAGIIEPTDLTRRSTRTDARRRKLTLWRSKLIPNPPAAPSLFNEAQP